METLHKILQESVSGGLWKFIGYYSILFLVFCFCLDLLRYIGKGLFLLLKYRLDILSRSEESHKRNTSETNS